MEVPLDPWSPLDPLSAIIIILALIVISCFFSLFDYALNACRRPRLQKEVLGPYRHIYEPVLKTLENPRVLTLTCRFWINMIRILAAFLAGISFVRYSGGLRHSMPADDIRDYLITAAVVVVLTMIAFFLGDLIPRLCARIAPERIAAALLPPLTFFSLPMKPINYLVQRFGPHLRSIFQLEAAGSGMTEDELRLALMEGEKSGIVGSNERTMVEGVFYLGDRPIRAFMTHRSEVQWLDVNAPSGEILAKVLKYKTQRCFPVTDGNQDEIIGAVYLEDIIMNQLEPNPRDLREIMIKAHFVPETMSALKAFESFKKGQANFLFVMDEYGGLAGIISAKALVEEIVGNLSATQQEETPLIKQEDGTWLADGLLNIDEAAEALSLPINNGENSGYHTLAGFVLSIAGELPAAGDSFVYHGFRFLVKEMDGNRIDKLIISKDK